MVVVAPLRPSRTRRPRGRSGPRTRVDLAGVVAGCHDLVHDAGLAVVRRRRLGGGLRARDLARVARWCDGGDVDVEAAEADDAAAGREWPMPTTYVVYKGRVPGVYDDWEDCRRQVHRFSGNNYKGYPTRVEAEGRYARYLAGEMRDMRRNRMKTMAFVMMVIVTMLVMFYVIVV
ncbi:hypothetical protein QYE76_035296 [Lolium multiflorum]|uniref:Ribonuclease H1 N-terminal domain-containing protein n=1 Tax=Lolium multiflorum TaxID=4521 RepID=A0AAD8R2N0_LOLMU|nr:hypothetical protein QYE76_035296 [Lolium multiflorum]